ncbi:MAG: M12 family metallopeptidase [Oligoflexia bacterium]|nr:M12 family metallopeptidase [Oligoflexia bacterium]
MNAKHLLGAGAIGIVLIGGFGLGQRLVDSEADRTSPSVPDAGTSAATSIPAVASRPAAVPVTRGRVVNLPASGHRPSSAERAAPQGNIIEFEVVNGLAIAQGDLILGRPDSDIPFKKGHTEAAPPQLWDQPVIPYLIHPSLPNPERVERALEYFRSETPLSFVAYQGQPDVIVFEPGEEHCYSYLGRIGGAQPIRLSAECQWSQIVHEVMHALGFVHEQSRRDRDRYVEILWDNIEDRFHGQFAQVPDAFMEAQRDTPFDFRSAMLYSPDAFARRKGQPTFRALNPGEQINPIINGLSPGDLQRLRRLFRL